MAVPVTCKFDEDRIKIEGAIDQKVKYGLFCHSRASNSKVDGLFWPELIQDFMAVLVTCKIDEDPIKSEVAIVRTTFSPLKVYGKIFHRSKACNSKVSLWLSF